MADHDSPRDGLFPLQVAAIERSGRDAGQPFEGAHARAVSSFLDATPFEMAMLFDAIDAGDTSEAETLAASLAATSAQIGADGLAECLDDIRHVASCGDRAGLRTRRAALGRECSRAFDLLEAQL